MTKILNAHMNGKNHLVLKIRHFYFIKLFLLPPANEVSGKVMFFLMFVCSKVGGSAYTRGVGQTPLLGTRKAGSAHPTGMLSCY